MKQQDSVFLLTLVDFLFQIIFFGLFAYAIYAVSTGKSQLDKKLSDYKVSGDVLADVLPGSFDAVKRILSDKNEEPASLKIIKEIDRQGYASLAELTDELSKLAPVKELAALNKVSKQIGGEKQISELSSLVSKSGGYAQAKNVLEKYIASGVGKPHCNPVTDATGKVVGSNALATIIAYDDRLVFEGETPQLAVFLKKIGLNYSEVSSLTLSEFSRVFRNVSKYYPECVHRLNFKERTRLVDSRDAAGQMFRLKVTKQ